MHPLSQYLSIELLFAEVFRVYPAFSFLNRECTPDDGQKSYSLQPDMNFEVPAGLPIYIPTYALHQDAEYYPQPEKFDPERFSPENIHRIPKAAYLPFGYGPRKCLAERLAYMTMRVGLFNLLRSHTIEKCTETPDKIKPHNLVVLMVPDKKIYVRFRRDADTREEKEKSC